MRTCNKNQAVFEKQGTPKMMIHPGQQEDRQRVIARLGPDQQLPAPSVGNVECLAFQRAIPNLLNPTTRPSGPLGRPDLESRSATLDIGRGR